MITPELVSYVRGETAKGISKDVIIGQLKTQGWTDVDISEVFAVISPVTINPVAANPTTSFHGGMVEPTLQPVPSHKKLWIFGGVGVVVLLVVGLFGYASGYFTSVQKMFALSLQAARTTHSATLDFQATIDASGLKDQDSFKEIPGMSNIFNFSMKGSYDTLDPKNTKIDTTYSLSTGTLEAGIDVKALKETLYARLTKAPELPFLSLKPYMNKWVSFPYSADQLQSNPFLASSGLNKSVLNTLTDEQKKHIYDITDNAHIIKVTAKHVPLFMNGSLVSHVEFDLDQAGIIAYLKELVAYVKTIDKDNVYDLGMITDTEYADMFKPLKNFHGEAWVGTFDHLPYKVNIDFTIEDPENPRDGSVKITLTMGYSNWNKKVEVEAPKDAMTIEQLEKSIMGEMVGTTPNLSNTENPPTSNLGVSSEDIQKRSEDALKIGVLSNMMSHADSYSFSSNSFKGFCRSKDKNGAYVLAKTLPEGTVYKCNDSATAFASWIQLSTGEYQCIDSQGVYETISAVPSGTSCPAR